MGAVAFLFGGPGAAEPGMGRDLYNRNPLVRESVDHADKVLKELGGVRPTKACFAGDAALITRPSVAGPCVLALAHGVCRALRARHVRPLAAAGLGWGELVALGALGALDFDDALKLLYLRGLGAEEIWARKPWHALAAQGLVREEWEAAFEGIDPKPCLAARIGPAHYVYTGEAGALGLVRARLVTRPKVRATLVEPGWQWPHAEFLVLGRRTAEALGALKELPAPWTPLQGAGEIEMAREPRDWTGRAAAAAEPLDWPAAGARLRALGMDTFVEIGHGAALGQALRADEPGLRALSTADAAAFAQAVKLS
jgi:[acyl-carrier-protein] S-malonyltransferase